jgi:hypothetical protein
MESLPKIVSVSAISPTRLLVRFDNAVEKEYDAAPLLSLPQFQLLRNPVFFRAARVDPGGYGISWSDNIDLSEFELWTRGTTLPAATHDR